jgi:Tfp pilus assembly protein PilF
MKPITMSCIRVFKIEQIVQLTIILAVITTLGGCDSAPTGAPYEPQWESSRSPIEAERLTLKAADYIGIDDEKAEKLLRRALTADLYHGPAHNNLGVVYLNQGKLYEAANEFEWARKLMPGHPDPRMNLALTLERAGRINQALATYETALEVYPGHIPTMQAFTRLQIRSKRTDDRTREYLEEIAFRGESETWREWARRTLVMGSHRY